MDNETMSEEPGTEPPERTDRPGLRQGETGAGRDTINTYSTYMVGGRYLDDRECRGRDPCRTLVPQGLGHGSWALLDPC